MAEPALPYEFYKKYDTKEITRETFLAEAELVGALVGPPIENITRLRTVVCGEHGKELEAVGGNCHFEQVQDVQLVRVFDNQGGLKNTPVPTIAPSSPQSLRGGRVMHKCDAHKNVPDAALYETVIGENVLLSGFRNAAVQALPDFVDQVTHDFKPETPFIWSFTPTRRLAVDVRQFPPSARSVIGQLAREGVFVGRVVVNG